MKKIMLLFAAVLAIMLSSAMAEAAAPKDTWQPVTLRNRILGADFTFYLPEGEWTVSNLTLSANTSCYFNTDGASVGVHFLAVSKDKRKAGDRLTEQEFTTEEEGRTLLKAGDHPAYLTEDNIIVIHLGDLPMDPDTYFLQAVIDPDDTGKGDAYLNEIREAVLALPSVALFDSGFPADKLINDGGTMYYPQEIDFQGTAIPLTQTIMRDSCLHVNGAYEDENGTQFSFYTTSAISSQKSFERTLAKDEYAEKAYGSFQAAEKRSYRTLYVEVWMGDYGYKYCCSYTNADESDAHYETASALVQALAQSGEYHALPEE